jgi:hypothetical protein
MDLRTALQQSQFAGLTDQQAKDHGDGAAAPLVDNLFHTVDWLAFQLGDIDQTRVVLNTLKAGSESDALLWAFAMKLNSTGVDFSNPQVQGQIDQLATAGGWSEELRNAVKWIGIKPRSWWEFWGCPVPDPGDIAMARASIAADAERARVIAAWNATINALDAGTITTYAAAVTLFGSH